MSIDAVIVGFNYGKNVRAGVLSQYLLALPHKPAHPNGQPTKLSTFCWWVC